MESVIIRAAIVYLFIFLMLRMTGKRTLSEMTPFDLVLLLIISEATQEALIDDDHSVTGGMLIITTLVFIDVVVSILSSRFKIFEKMIDNVPMIIMENGNPLTDRMGKARVKIDDILEAARKKHGLTSLDEIQYAILEKDGEISIIPRR
jgi:uncharacterized membrane protein YcaP (DUF421 family)